MDSPEKTFLVRFSLSAQITDEMWEDEDFDENAWLAEWEARIKPGLIRAVFAHLRTFPEWQAHIRNRGVSPLEEIEIAVARRMKGEG